MLSNQLSIAVKNAAAHGYKGGSQQPKPPVEAPDTLSNTAFARIIDLVSEGEIVGLVNGARSIYLDETPLQSDTGYNFGGVTWQERHGSLYQEYIKGFPNAESETGVNFELKQTQPYVRSINKLELSAARVRVAVARLLSQDDKGNRNGSSVTYRIELQTDGGPYVLMSTQTITGKASNKYVRSTRVDLPAARVGWQIRVTRITPDSSTDMVQNPTTVEAITEVIDRKFVMPNRALIATQFDAQSFSGVPKRTFHIKGRIIQVPSNYDAESRIYFGPWDGTFKPAWTNNPAWIYYDLLLHKRYGLGNQITAAQVDKWELYRIGQYCDVMVDDGKGGLEPRMTCNLYLQERAPALRVMQDIATIFRGISYWGAGQTYVSADIPGDSVGTFTNAQVIDGTFDYRGSPLESRYNVALVSWNDPSDFYRAKVEYVQDRKGIDDFGGINKVEMVAFGCSSQGQAQRAGKWALITNTLESEIVSFKVPLSGAYIRPGDVIRIADNDLAGRDIGGRILAATERSITSDRPVKALAGDKVTLMVGGEPFTMTVAAHDTVANIISFTSPFPVGVLPRRMDPWAIESTELRQTEWRVSTVSENETEKGGTTYSVTATKHVPGKFNAIEYGTAIEKPPISVIPPSVQQPVGDIKLTSNWAVDQTMAVTTMTISWDAVPNATRYEVQWRANDKDWVYAGPAYGTEMNVAGIYAGVYTARVQAVNSIDVHSRWSTSLETLLNGKEGMPPAVAYLKTIGITYGIGLEWGFLPGSTDTLRTEIQYGVAPNPDTAQHLGDFAYPINTHTMMGLAAGVRFYFRARLIDRTGNIGPWSAWVDGLSSNEATDVLSYLKGQITQTELGRDLAEEIPKISGDGPGSVNERLKDAQDAVNVQINSINAQLAELAGAAEWVATKQYATNDIVKHEGGLYRAKGPNINSEPPSADWDKIGDYADVGEALAAMAVQLNDLKTSVSVIDGKLTANVEKTDAIFAQVNPPMAGAMGDYAGSEVVRAGVWSDRSARVTEDTALAVRIDGLVAEVGANKAEINRIDRALTTKTDALAESIVLMKAEINSEINPKINSVTAALAEETRVRASETEALAQRQTTLETTVGGHTSAIEQNTQLINKVNGDLSLSWSVKMQANNLGGQQWAAFGLGIDGSSGKLESRFFIAADQFYVTSSLAGGFADVPFAVVNGQTFIKEAFIQDGTITNGKIGAYIQSDDYVEGMQGWRLDKAGGGTFRLNGNGAGGRRVMTATGDRYYDTNGTLRIKIEVT